MTGDQLLGFLSMDKSERGYYSAEHANRLESLAGHAALALLNALTFGEVEQASITDFVTGIYNRRYFHEQLQLEIDRARRIGYPVSLLIFDIDHFKQVNDTYGHPIGDRVLQMVARRIKDELRAVDILARYGGEEFAVILPGTPASSLAGVGERLRQVIAMRPSRWKTNRFRSRSRREEPPSRTMRTMCTTWWTKPTAGCTTPRKPDATERGSPNPWPGRTRNPRKPRKRRRNRGSKNRRSDNRLG